METEFIIDSKIQKVILELLSQKIEIPVGIYEKVGNKIKGLFSTEYTTGQYFSEFCKLTTTDPILKEYCEEDHKKRAFEGKTSCKQQCHFGLWNYCYPIVINDTVRASLLLGQRLIMGQEEASKKVFAEACKKYELENKKIQTLNSIFDQTSKTNVDFFDQTISMTVEHFYEQIKSIFESHIIYKDFKIKVRNTAHEFLLPVQSIVANSEVLAEKLKASPELKDYALDVIMEMENLNLVAKNLFKNLDIEEKITDFNSISILDLLTYCKDLFSRFAKNNNMEITINKPSGYANFHIEASYSHLLHAFKNLIHNAIKYSSGHTYINRYIKINIDTFVDDVRVEIVNFGFGIKEYEYEKIFEDGYRGEMVRDAHRNGSGIGLAEVRKIISQHRGRYNVRSLDEKSGHLNIFTITLPRKQTERS